MALDPTENFQQAGMVLWQDEDTWLRLTAESNSGSDATEWARQTDVTSPYTGFNCGAAYPARTCPVYGSAFLAVPGFSPGATYNLAGFDPAAPLKIGILATAAGAPDPIPAHFAYVHVYRPQG